MLATIHLSRRVGRCSVIRQLVDDVDCMVVYGPTHYIQMGGHADTSISWAQGVARKLDENDVDEVRIINSGTLPRPIEIGSGPAAEYADDLMGGELGSENRYPFDEISLAYLTELFTKGRRRVE